MNMMADESGQGAAEYILLFGGVIVIAIAALLIYRAYFTGASNIKASQDISTCKKKCYMIYIWIKRLFGGS